MRIYLLPISTRRALIYCEPKSHQIPLAQRTYLDRIVEKGNTTWADWEKNTDSTFDWKRRTTTYGNMLFRRIPFEEWGLKSVPSLKNKDREAVQSLASPGEHGSQTDQSKGAAKKVEVLYPRLYQSLCETAPLDTFKKLVESRMDLHRSRRNWSIIGIPLTIPFALVPM